MSQQTHASLLKRQEAFKSSLKKQPIFPVKQIPSSPSISSETSAQLSSSAATSPSGSSSIAYAAEHSHIQSYKGVAYATAISSMKYPRHLNSIIHNILQCLKVAERPLTPDDIFRATQVDIKANPTLFDALKSSDKIIYIDGKFEFKTKYRVKSKEDLAQVLRELPRYQGFSIDEIKEIGPKADVFVEELLKEGQIFQVFVKENYPKILFYNWYNQYKPIDSDILELWNSIDSPTDVDLTRALHEAGLKSIEVLQSYKPVTQALKKRKTRASNRRLKITNIHLDDIDLTKDYVPS